MKMLFSYNNMLLASVCSAIPIICDCRPVAGVMGLLDACCSCLADFSEHDRRGNIMFGVTDRSGMLQPW